MISVGENGEGLLLESELVGKGGVYIEKVYGYRVRKWREGACQLYGIEGGAIENLMSGRPGYAGVHKGTILIEPEDYHEVPLNIALLCWVHSF